MEEWAASLHEQGCVILPAFPDEATRCEWEERLAAELRRMPECRPERLGDPAQYVLGGFGGLGNPSAFHNDTVRALRLWLMRTTYRPLLRRYAQLLGLGDQVCAEMLFDRVGVRHKSFGAVGKESWHRDTYYGGKGMRALPKTLRGGTEADVIFGGWVNLSGSTQRFVGILGSHHEASAATGFTVYTGAEALETERLREQASRRVGQCDCDQNGSVLVPPGHAVIFPKSLLHAVYAGTVPTGPPQMRLFVGVRLTEDRAPLFPDTARWIARNAVPRLPSGQMPPMFSQNHFALFNHKTITKFRAWGGIFKSQCVFERRTTSGTVYSTPGSKGNAYPACNRERYMPSLRAMRLPLFAYSAEDAALMSPQPLA
jgi:hypothetical protein